MNDSILVFGQTGQLARALTRSLRARGQEFETLSTRAVDLAAQPEKAARLIKDKKPSYVINASAFTDVDGAETNQDAAFALNRAAPGFMAQACAALGIPFVHISTDYVFNGRKKGPYQPSDKTGPLNVYGQSKMEGERAVLQSGVRGAVLRTSWVFDGTGKNFLTSMLKHGQTLSEMTIVADQFGRPTYAGHLAEAVLAVLAAPARPALIYHVTGGGAPVSWHGFATEIFARAGIDCKPVPIPSKDYKVVAARPANSVLDISDFERQFSHALLPWQAGLDAAFFEFRS